MPLLSSYSNDAQYRTDELDFEEPAWEPPQRKPAPLNPATRVFAQSSKRGRDKDALRNHSAAQSKMRKTTSRPTQKSKSGSNKFVSKALMQARSYAELNRSRY
eukprot:gb/GECG01007075.1/.p1 GENE.gb/GECG01007075.1/~~gb/GECG01007075.1/.p1  ORF type:complete len:103 (+),score=11.15 gb/GECG01007075.1/:1-309(+)